MILLTGIGGFLGKHVAREALARGYKVRGTLRDLDKAGEVIAALGGDKATKGLEFAAADLTSDDGWEAAAAGCAYLLHTASPFPMQVPKERMALVPAAREGTLRALRAAKAAGMRRAVVTSSTAAIIYGHPDPAGHTFTERDWTDTDSPEASAYNLSKTLAERAAWEFAAGEGAGLELSVVNPGFILGPPLDARDGTSTALVRLSMSGKYPAVPRIGFPVVDVRDAAAGHLAAMEQPAAAGERILLTGGYLTLMDIARILARNFPAYRRRLPRFELPDFVVRAGALFDSNLAAVRPNLGRHCRTSNDKARTLLGLTFRDPEEALVAMAQALIEQRQV